MDAWHSQTTLLLTFIFLTFAWHCSAGSYTTPRMRSPIVASNVERLLHHQTQGGDDEAFLEAHNKARLHAGEKPFVWDPKLAQYALKLSVDCKMIHSDGPYGENIFWGEGQEWNALMAVGLWVQEHRFYDRATMKCQPGKMCGHYTQVVWRDSVRLGCARVQCVNGDYLAVCSYDPPGNYVGEDPFVSHLP